jgi:hypothetical protein
VTSYAEKLKTPTLRTLEDLLSLVDSLRSDSEKPRGQFEWSYQEITQEELPEDLVSFHAK